MADWMAFNVADYVANTLHLTTRQHGAYILLICAAWNGKGALPGTDEGLRAIAKLSPREWKDDGPALKAFLTRRGEAWIHERVEFEWNDAQSLIAAKSKAGREGARRRWQGRGNGKAMAVPSQTQRQNDAPIPLPEPVTTTDQVEAGAAAAFAAYQARASEHGWPNPQFMNSTRRYAIEARLAECGGLDGWTAALDAAAGAGFLKDSSGKPQRWFDIDWLTKPQNFTRLMEGRYAERHDAAEGNRTGLSAALAGLA